MRRWKPGRQGTGYRKLLLAQGRWPLPFDAWLLHFPEGSYVPVHRDPTEGQHWRLNIILKAADQGGTFISRGTVWDGPRLKIFRSDLCAHAVTPVVAGNRWVLSIGWVLREPAAQRDAA